MQQTTILYKDWFTVLQNIIFFLDFIKAEFLSSTETQSFT